MKKIFEAFQSALHAETGLRCATLVMVAVNPETQELCILASSPECISDPNDQTLRDKSRGMIRKWLDGHEEKQMPGGLN